jgi:hypothetical protein
MEEKKFRIESKLPVKEWYERKVVRSRRSICKPLNIKIYDFCVVCEIYHGLGFIFIERNRFRASYI